MAGSDFDVYKSGLARSQLRHDMEPYRVSLYTNLKADHPADWLTGEPCDCEAGGDGWERRGVAMRARWPRATQGEPEPGRELEAG